MAALAASTRMATTGRLARQASLVPSKGFVARPALRLSQVARRADKQVVRAEEGSVDVDQLVKDLQDKWDRVENKTTVVLYGAGALVALWFSSTLVTALNSIPILPKALELVGLGYTAWFTYRYLLFKSSREELKKEVEELKKKVAGNDL